MAGLSRLFRRRVWPRFWAKTFFHLLTPGGYGYMRRLRRGQDTTYVHDRDKHPVRYKHHGGGGWRPETKGGLQKRDYSDYEEYVTHQGLKLDEMIKMAGGFRNRLIFNYRLTFYSRFRHLPRLLPPDARILCCGARQGTEVDVLRDLGFSRAVGIDLNPGPNNRLVGPGDMMKLTYPDNSLDLIYSNCVDHAYDFDAMVAEHVRALKPNGFLLYDVSLSAEQGGGPFEAIAWQRSEDLIVRLLDSFRTLVQVERDPLWVWALLRDKRSDHPPRPDGHRGE